MASNDGGFKRTESLLLALETFYFKIYLKRTNFRVYIFSRFSRILVDFAKLNTRKISFNVIREN